MQSLNQSIEVKMPQCLLGRLSIFFFWKCELKYDMEKMRMNSLKKMIVFFIKGKVIVFNVTDSTESDYISNFFNPMILIQNIIIPRNYES